MKLQVVDWVNEIDRLMDSRTLGYIMLYSLFGCDGHFSSTKAFFGVAGGPCN